MRAALWPAALLVACLPVSSSAYVLATATSHSCHERITGAAFELLLTEVNAGAPIPNDRLLKRMLAGGIGLVSDELTREEQFVVLSAIVGVRAPDTEGHSTLNLSVLRELHADPAPDGQYAHALRAPDDDGLMGDLLAVEGTRGIIRAELEKAIAIARSGDVYDKRLIFLDHYGSLDVTVLLPAWHLGRAIHALQDAHAHMLRDADLDHVLHVTNYVEAIEGTRDEGRDGLAHSSTLDNCHLDEVAPVAEKATERTAALVIAFGRWLQFDDPSLVELGLAPCPDEATDPRVCGWIVYNPPCEAALKAGDTARQAEVCCTQANNYCDTPWVDLARREPAGPYLGCATAPGSGGGWLALLLLLPFARRRWLLLGLAVLVPALAQGEPARGFVSVEGHAAALDDTPDSAILAPVFGFGLRTGWRFGPVRAVLHVERDWWVPMEIEVKVDPGALNLGLGAELLLFDDVMRMSAVIGPSILMFDTGLDDKGTVGIFAEMRPAGFRWMVLDAMAIVFDPFTVAVVQPVLRDPPLRKIERRTSVGIEAVFL